MKRISVVDQLSINSLSHSSIIEIGDVHQTKLTSKAIALQKEGQTFAGELKFQDYPIFSRTANNPKSTPLFSKRTFYHEPYIYLQNIKVTAISMSSMVQMGQLNHLEAESRIKHFRFI